MTSKTFKSNCSCPFFPDVTLEFSTKIQWSLVVAKKHITPTEPIIHMKFECVMQKENHRKLPIRKCPVNEIKENYVKSYEFRELLRNALFSLGGTAWLEYIELIVHAPFSLTETDRSQVTAPDGTKYIKSDARFGSPLYGKWHKIPPGFRNLSEAGNLATVVDSPPKEWVRIEHVYCFHP
jgi:hypothetical protein